nr:hypothetical protein [Streptomyces sp. FT05W]
MDVLHGQPGGVRGQAFEEQGRRQLGDLQESGLGACDDGGLDGLDGLAHVHPVGVPQVFVEIAVLQLLRRQARHQSRPDVQVLDGHRGAVDESQPGDVHDLLGGRHPQLAADPGAGREGRELQQPARPRSGRLRHAQGEVGGDELLGDLLRCHEHPASVLPDEQSGGHEFVDGGAHGGAGHVEQGAQGPLGRDGVPGAPALDQLENRVTCPLPLEQGPRYVGFHARPSARPAAFTS